MSEKVFYWLMILIVVAGFVMVTLGVLSKIQAVNLYILMDFFGPKGPVLKDPYAEKMLSNVFLFCGSLTGILGAIRGCKINCV